MKQQASTGAPRSRRVAIAMAVVFLLIGIVLRVAQAADPFERVSADEHAYTSIATELDERGRYTMGSGGPAWHWAPGTPAAFAVARTLDPPPRGSMRAQISSIYWLQAFVGALTMVTAGLLAYLLAGVPAGALAVAIVALYPPFVRFTGEQVSEPLGALLMTTAVALAVKSLRDQRRLAFVGTGLVLGVTLLVRTDLGVAGMVLVGATAFGILRQHSWPQVLSFAISSLVGLVVVVGPWVAYASARNDSFVPITTAGAPSLFIGTYLPGGGTTDGVKEGLADEVGRRFPEQRDVDPLKIPGSYVTTTVVMRHPGLDRESALLRESFNNLENYAIGRPLEFAQMMAAKAWHMWSEPAGGGAITYSGWVKVLHLGLAAGLLAGMALGWRRTRHIAFMAGLALAASHTLFHTVVVAQPRYLLPLLPALMALGAAGWTYWLDGTTEGKRPVQPTA